LRDPENRLTQKQLADRLGTSQPRVSRLEVAEDDCSLDLMARALFAAGGDLRDLAAAVGGEIL
jgi:predicted transcriptional regulator